MRCWENFRIAGEEPCWIWDHQYADIYRQYCVWWRLSDEKVGKKSQLDHQLCHTHGLHLAVCDILYETSVANASIEDFNDEDEEIFAESLTTAILTTNEIPTCNHRIEDVLKKERKVLKLQKKYSEKRSPAKVRGCRQKTSCPSSLNA